MKSDLVNSTDVNRCDKIFIGMGANLSSATGSPTKTLNASLGAMASNGITIVRCSPWYRSQPVPVSDQAWYVNGVAVIETELEARHLLKTLHDIELQFGRHRKTRNEARVLDLDLLAYGDQQSRSESGLILPHPRLHERAFVLIPLADVEPDWRHPVTKLSIANMLAALPKGQIVEQLG